MKGRGGLLSPRHQSAETSQTVPEPTHTFTLTWSAHTKATKQRGQNGDSVRAKNQETGQKAKRQQINTAECDRTMTNVGETKEFN